MKYFNVTILAAVPWVEVNTRSRIALMVINIPKMILCFLVKLFCKRDKFLYSDQQVEAPHSCIHLIDTYFNSLIVFAAK